MAAEYILEMKDITKKYGENTVLSNVSLKIRPGEIHALLGENGAGKSTLMNIITDNLAATSGTVYWEGKKKFNR